MKAEEAPALPGQATLKDSIMMANRLIARNSNESTTEEASDESSSCPIPPKSPI